MDICIDTNAYSALKRGNRQVREIIEEADSVWVPTVVLGELYAGFAMGSNPVKNVRSIHNFVAMPGINVAPVYAETAERYGQIIKQLRDQGSPIPTNDVWIAAITFEIGADLLTDDTHFTHIPLLRTLQWR